VLVVILVGRLAWYGHDDTIGLPGLLVAFVFLSLMMLLAIRVASSFRNASTGAVLRQVGAGSVAAVILALGVFIAAVAVDSLRLGATRLVEAWNVLIFFYPIYLIVSFGIARALVFYGGRMLVRTAESVRMTGP